MTKTKKLLVGLGAIGVGLLVIIVAVVASREDGPEELVIGDRADDTEEVVEDLVEEGAAEVVAPEDIDIEGAWTLSGDSVAGYRVVEDFVGGISDFEAVGRTSEITGDLTIDGTTVDGAAWSEAACGEWDAADTLRHLVAVVDWYHQWLDRAVKDDSSIPFVEDEFSVRNSAGIERYRDLDGPTALLEFERRATEYLELAIPEWERPFGYPGGVVTVGLHCGIAATEWHLHA